MSVQAPETKGDKTWLGHPPYGPAGNFSHSHWSWDSPKTLRAENGYLVQTAWYDPTITDHWTNWRSPALSSMDRHGNGFAQRFGYWECQAQMPKVTGQGAYVVFWLFGAWPNWRPGYEIDIIEYWSREVGRVAHTVHPWNADGSQAPPPYQVGHWTEVSNPTNSWHTYGCMVTPWWIAFYVDGKCTAVVPTDLAYLDDPLYCIINYAVEPNNGGNPTGSPFNTNGKSSLLVDFVRAYSPPSHWVIPSPAPHR